MAPRPTAKKVLAEHFDEIIEALASGESQLSVAKRYGVAQSSVSQFFSECEAEIEEARPKRKPAEPPVVKVLAKRVRELETNNAAIRELRDTIRETAAEMKPPAPQVRTVAVRRGQPASKKAVDVVFHVSDLQYGMRVSPEEVPGGNYNPDVFALERLPRFVDGALALLELVAMAHPIRCVWFAQGGDMVEGNRVFKGQEWHLAIDAGKQVTQLAPLWANTLATLATTAKKLGARSCAVLSVKGNHGVDGGRGAGAMPASLNFDYLFYEMTRHALAAMGGGGVDMYDTAARDAVYFDAQGSTFLLSHGDQDRGGGIVGFAAVNGTRNDVMVRLQTGINHRYHLKGHYHKGATIPPGGDSEILWNGSWEGPTNLSIARGGGAEPMQRAHVIHPEFGRFIEWPIRLAPGMSRTNLPEVMVAP